MGKRKTPLIQKLRDQSGTMYIFPSASEDINLNINNTSNGVALSHYALLNIPTLTRTQMLMGYTPSVDHPITDGNSLLQVSLQNYMMNLETLLLNNDKYNFQDFNTVTERVFWKWFRKVTQKEFTAVNDKFYKNDSVVCFGKIDAENHLSTEFSMFNETYINIPTSYGGGPIYFKKRRDTLIDNGSKFSVNTPEYLEGREDSNILNISYTDFNDKPFLDNNESSDTSYEFTDNDLFEIVKDTTSINEAINVELGKTVYINTFDDINVDVNQQLGNLIADEFNFNAILLYYTIYDLNDSVKHAEAINLFGIIFLDGLKPATNTAADDDYIIHPFVKRKSTTVNFGNSFSFRVNMKTLSIYDNTDAVIQDNTTMSSIDSVDFSDVISQLNRAINIMNTNVKTTTAIQDEYAKMKTTYNDQAEKINTLTHQLDAYINGNKADTLQVTTLIADNMYKTLPEDEASTAVTDNRKKEFLDVNLSLYPDLIKVSSTDPNKLYIDPYNELFNKSIEHKGTFEYMLGYAADGSALLDYTEFVPYIILKLQEHEGEIAKKFDIININNNSVVTNTLQVNDSATIKNLSITGTLTVGDIEATDIRSLLEMMDSFTDYQGRLQNVESWVNNKRPSIDALCTLTQQQINLLSSIDFDRVVDLTSDAPDGIYNELINIDTRARFEEGEMDHQDLKAWYTGEYGIPEYYAESCKWNKIGDFVTCCYKNLVMYDGPDSSHRWTQIYYSLPFECVESAHGVVKGGQHGQVLYWSVIPDFGSEHYSVLRIAPLYDASLWYDNLTSITITYKCQQ